MSERWERELQTLRRAGPRADLWARVEEGPHGSPSAPTPGRRRLLAGGVAFAVFIAAGAFAWNAFRPAPQEGLPPAGAPQAIMAFNDADPRTPSLTLTVGGGTHPATLGTHSYSFDGRNGFVDAVTPTFTDADAIAVVRGTPLLIANAPPTLAMSAYEGMTVNWGPPVGTPLPLDLIEPGWNFDLPAGRYLLVVDAQWDDAQAEFWLPIQVVDSSVPADATVTHGSHAPVPRAVSQGCPTIVGDVFADAGSAVPGETVSLSGPIYHRSEDGSFFLSPTEDYQAWWGIAADDYADLGNAPATISSGDDAAPSSPGPRMLADDRPNGACGFDIDLVVPLVAPGSYEVTVISADAAGYTAYGEVTLVVLGST